MEIGDIILVRGNSFASKLIRKVTGSEWTHLALYAGGGYVLETDWNSKAAIVPNPYPLSGLDYVVLQSKVPLTKTQQDCILTSVIKHNQTGNKYDFFLLAGLLLKTKFPKWTFLNGWNSKNNYICTELVQDVLRSAGLDLFPGRKGDLFPHEFLDSKDLKVTDVVLN